MMNYLSRFDPNIANLTHHLTELLKKGSDPNGLTFIHWISQKIIETLSNEGKSSEILQARLGLVHRD